MNVDCRDINTPILKICNTVSIVVYITVIYVKKLEISLYSLAKIEYKTSI